MPKISVVVPAYNRADMLPDAILSVQNQTFADWELIVVDDGSGDNTRALMDGYADPRIRYIYQENKGLPGARNTGILNSSGEYVAFLDSDDLFLPCKLAVQAEMLDGQPDLGLVAGGYFEVDRHLNVLREVQPWWSAPALDLTAWLSGCPTIPTAVLVRRPWLERAGLFDESMRYVEDWDLWLRMSSLGCRMEWSRQTVSCYRIHGSNMMRQVQLMKAGMLTMLDKFFSARDLSEAVQGARKHAYTQVYLDAAARAYAAGVLDEGKECLGHAIELEPALLEGDPPLAWQSLASFALGPLAGDADAFMDGVASSLPENGAGLSCSRRKRRGLMHAVSVFDGSQRAAYRGLARHALRALWYDPSWARNRGFLKIAARGLWRDAWAIRRPSSGPGRANKVV